MIKKVSNNNDNNTDNNTDTSDLFKTADYDTKIGEIENKINDHDHSKKYVTDQKFDKLTSESFPSRLAQANLASKMILLIL